jgi:chemotaxis-related protein WspD
MSAVKKQKLLEVDDCWKRIGVWGNKECPELIHCLHCRNCKTYSSTSRHLLDRKPPAGYVQSWTKVLAKPEKEILPGQVSAFIFRIGPEWFALPANLLLEVLEVRSVHSIPHRSNPILLGLINVRGEMQLCVSVGKLLGVDKGFTEKEENNSKIKVRMLSVSMQGECMVFFVSEASGIHMYHPGELQPLPATLPREASACSKGLLHWENHHVAVLDDTVLFKKLIGNIQ